MMRLFRMRVINHTDEYVRLGNKCQRCEFSMLRLIAGEELPFVATANSARGHKTSQIGQLSRDLTLRDHLTGVHPRGLHRFNIRTATDGLQLGPGLVPGVTT